MPGGGQARGLCHTVQTLLTLNLLVQNNITVLLVKQLGYRGKDVWEREETWGKEKVSGDSRNRQKLPTAD